MGGITKGNMLFKPRLHMTYSSPEKSAHKKTMISLKNNMDDDANTWASLKVEQFVAGKNPADSRLNALSWTKINVLLYVA